MWIILKVCEVSNVISKKFQICGKFALITNLKANSNKFTTIGRGVGDNTRLFADVHTLYNQLFHLNRTESFKYVTIKFLTNYFSRLALNVVKAVVFNSNRLFSPT